MKAYLISSLFIINYFANSCKISSSLGEVSFLGFSTPCCSLKALITVSRVFISSLSIALLCLSLKVKPFSEKTLNKSYQ